MASPEYIRKMLIAVITSCLLKLKFNKQFFYPEGGPQKNLIRSRMAYTRLNSLRLLGNVESPSPFGQKNQATWTGQH